MSSLGWGAALQGFSQGLKLGVDVRNSVEDRNRLRKIDAREEKDLAEEKGRKNRLREAYLAALSDGQPDQGRGGMSYTPTPTAPTPTAPTPPASVGLALPAAPPPAQVAAGGAPSSTGFSPSPMATTPPQASSPMATTPPQAPSPMATTTPQPQEGGQQEARGAFAEINQRNLAELNRLKAMARAEAANGSTDTARTLYASAAKLENDMLGGAMQKIVAQATLTGDFSTMAAMVAESAGGSEVKSVKVDPKTGKYIVENKDKKVFAASTKTISLAFLQMQQNPVGDKVATSLLNELTTQEAAAAAAAKTSSDRAFDLMRDRINNNRADARARATAGGSALGKTREEGYKFWAKQLSVTPAQAAMARSALMRDASLSPEEAFTAITAISDEKAPATLQYLGGNAVNVAGTKVVLNRAGDVISSRFETPKDLKKALDNVYIPEITNFYANRAKDLPIEDAKKLVDEELDGWGAEQPYVTSAVKVELERMRKEEKAEKKQGGGLIPRGMRTLNPRPPVEEKAERERILRGRNLGPRSPAAEQSSP